MSEQAHQGNPERGDARVKRRAQDPGKFSAPRKAFAKLDASRTAQLMADSSDVCLVVDAKGIIRDLAFGEGSLAEEGCEGWLNSKFEDTVTIESRAKVADMAREAAEHGKSRWRQVNHPIRGGNDMPVAYRMMALSGSDRLLAVGRDLRSLATLQQRLMDVQLSVERDYSQRRELETRYRLLFQLTREAVIIIDATTQAVVEANPAAAAWLGERGDGLVGRVFPRDMSEQDAAKVNAMLAAVRSSGESRSTRVKLEQGDRDVVLSASLFRQGSGPLFLVQLAAHGDGAAPLDGTPMAALAEHAPDGLVVTDHTGLVITANAAFLNLAQIATESQANGESLGNWIGRPGADFSMLLGHIREHGTVRLFGSLLRGSLGSNTEVEVSAVRLDSCEPPALGFLVRNTGPRVAPDSSASAVRNLPRSVDQLTELVGRVKLRDLVRESTDLVERLCIEAALELSGDNRSAAAEILGLSRQSLYVKLRRYGLGELEGED